MDLCKTLLATHPIHKSKRYFLAKVSMDWLGMRYSFLVPSAAIVKLPKGGHLWTGEHLHGLWPVGVDLFRNERFQKLILVQSDFRREASAPLMSFVTNQDLRQ